MPSSKFRKGIILAGGQGQRLSPITLTISKQLIPVYDKPMIYYPISTLMLCGIRDILIITTPNNKSLFEKLLGDGSGWGVKFSYEIQIEPKGVAQGILIGEEFISNESVAVVLGDNLFHGNGLSSLLNCASLRSEGATVFGYPVSDPERYGVLQLGESGEIINIEEKPKNALSEYAVTGIYFYDNSVIDRVKRLKISSRGELEISELNNHYLNDGLLNVEIIGRGIAWLDTGTFESLQEASAYIRALEHRQGLKVGCPEEIAWRNGWIDDCQLKFLAESLLKSGYGEYLLKLLKRKTINFNRNNMMIN